MKRFWTAMAVAGFAFVLLAGCNDYNNSIQYNTGATLTNVSPNGLPAGSGPFLLTVNASQFNGFNSTSVIQWNGKKLTTSQVIDTTTLTATVPADLLAKPGTAVATVHEKGIHDDGGCRPVHTEPRRGRSSAFEAERCHCRALRSRPARTSELLGRMTPRTSGGDTRRRLRAAPSADECRRGRRGSEH